MDKILDNSIIGWWSGGITSAVTCKLIIDLYGLDKCRFIFLDTKNEGDDTYRFKKDCEQWYGKEIESITAIGDKYDSIQDVWRKHESLNVAHGAICSSELKRRVRERWEENNEFTHQAFGFDINESKRAIGMKLNHEHTNPIFPLLMYGLRKKDCIEMVKEEGIEIPKMYRLGFKNNNCWKTGCVQGGIGYWQKIKREYPDKFDRMAEMEHELTDKRGEPVTMLKDQSKEAKKTGNTLVFLKPHPDYPELKDISQKKGREPKPLVECNGFCGVNDLKENNKTHGEINYMQELDFNDKT